jgi:6-methylsalicylate decarboxylase
MVPGSVGSILRRASSETARKKEEQMERRAQGRLSFRGCNCCDETLTAAASALSRRSLLGGAAGLALAGLAPRARAQTAAKIPIVDVHHHLAPPAYIADLKQRKLGLPPTLEWTPEKSLADMDAAGVASAILSITTPGIWFGDADAAATLARACNEYGAKLSADTPRRFGLFAALPLPDVDASLREIEYALDTLKAEGIGLFTSYGDKWLGDPAFVPVMDELNRRKAVVYTHPTDPACCRNLIAGVSEPIIEYGTDTSRTIASLLFTGTASRCPDIKFIFSHGGGTMPFLIERFVRLPLLSKAAAANTTEGVTPLLQRFHYDTAQVANPVAMAALTKVVPTSQILFGTDFPYRTALDHVRGLKQIFDDADLRKIASDNARALLPRLQAI